jgi:hypothetical protein
MMGKNISNFIRAIRHKALGNTTSRICGQTLPEQLEVLAGKRRGYIRSQWADPVPGTIETAIDNQLSADVGQACEKLRRFIEQQGFKGYDPYDALNSPALRLLSLGLKYPRIAAIQSLKRLPVNLRPLLGVKPGLNPKGLGLFLWGFAKLYRLSEDRRYLEQIHQLLGLLNECKSPRYSGNCWGYNFDWQSRAFFVPKYTPTIVNSSLIGHALLDTYEVTGASRALAMATPIKEFLLRDLHRAPEGDTFCFSYTPIDKTAVHNANLLGASLLIRLYGYCKDEELKETALGSLRYTMKYQRPDGSWWYAETPYQRWIDSFHTGFNLQSILYFLREGFGDNDCQAFTRGVRFYAQNLFLHDGTAKYYHDRCYPIDIHSYAQAIVLFSNMGEEYRELLRRIVTRMLATFHDQGGYFYFQRTRRFTNKIPYMRWAQGWAFHALTEYMLCHERR